MQPCTPAVCNFLTEPVVTRHSRPLWLLAAAISLAASASAQTPAAAPVAKNDYAQAASWLCRPGRQDACAVDLSTSVVTAAGAVSRETWSAHANPPIDCFYVYPTI